MVQYNVHVHPSMYIYEFCVGAINHHKCYQIFEKFNVIEYWKGFHMASGYQYTVGFLNTEITYLKKNKSWV
jgi:hypothetical protein